MSTLVDVCGVEWGSWDATNMRQAAPNNGIFVAGGDSSAATTVESAIKRSGGYSLRCRLTASGGFSYNVRTLDGSGSLAVVSVWIYVAAYPTGVGDAVEFLSVDGAFTNFPALGIGKTGTLMAHAGGGYTSLTDTISTATWTLLDVIFDTSTSTYTINVKVNGGTTRSWSLGGQTAHPVTGITMEVDGTSTGGGGSPVAAGDIYFDDLVVSRTSGDFPLGEHVVKALRPNADGTHSNVGNFSDDAAVLSGANPAWDNINDATFPTGTTQTGFVSQQANGTTDYVEVTYPNTTESSIAGVIAYAVRNSGSTTAHTASASMFIGTTPRQKDIWTVTNPTNWGVTSCRYGHSPIDSNPTVADLDAVVTRFGYSSDATPDPKLLAWLIEYAVPVSAGGLKALATVVAGVGSVAPALMASRAIAATSVGVAVVTPALKATRAIAATPVGTSTVTPGLRVTRRFNALIAGVGAIVAALVGNRRMASTVVGVSSVSPALRVDRKLTVNIPGVGTVTPSAKVLRRYATTVVGTSTITVPGLVYLRSLATSIAGIGSVTPALKAIRRFNATPTGTSSVTPSLGVVRRLGSTVAGSSQISVAIRMTRFMQSVVSGTATLAVDLTKIAGGGVVNFAVSVIGVAVVTPALKAIRRVNALATGASTVSANLRGSRNLATTVVGTSTVASDLKGLKFLQVLVAGTSTVSATLRLPKVAMAVSIAGSAAISAGLRTFERLQTLIAGGAHVISDLTIVGAPPPIGPAITAAMARMRRTLRSTGGPHIKRRR